MGSRTSTSRWSSGRDACSASRTWWTSTCFTHLEETPPWCTVTNISKILDAWERLGKEPVPHTFARQLVDMPKKQTLEGWLRSLLTRTRYHERARWLVDELRTMIAPPDPGPAPSRKKEAPPSLTFAHTATRDFEDEYWNTIAELSAGKFVNKNNADCVLDKATQAALAHPWRDLEGMGDHLLDYYARLVAERGMQDAVQFGELPFRWQTQYSFPWMGGWVNNQEGKTYERNLLVMIPGRDRCRAVIMADHYDTAYMYDRLCQGVRRRRGPPRRAGADDNCSATAALMLGAVPFLESEPAGQAGVRHLARASDRRGISRRGAGSVPDVPMARRGDAGAAHAGRRPARPVRRARFRASTCST